jgi:hypothetical protein
MKDNLGKNKNSPEIDNAISELIEQREKKKNLQI